MTEAIAKLIQNNDFVKKEKSLSIHFLMSCHSTPVFSHMYVEERQLIIKTLDCSPDCRSSHSCESNLFDDDPLNFLKELYFADHGDRNDMDACIDPSQSGDTLPDVVAIFDDHTDKIYRLLSQMGLEKVGELSHSLVGLQVGKNLVPAPIFSKMLLYKQIRLDSSAIRCKNQ